MQRRLRVMKNTQLTPHAVDKALRAASLSKSVSNGAGSMCTGYVVNYQDRGAIRVAHRAWSMGATAATTSAHLDAYQAALEAAGYQVLRQHAILTVTRKDTDADA
jgi:hypothetical protein